MNTISQPDKNRRGPLALFAMVCTGSLLAVACASVPPPTDDVAVSTAAVAHAVGAGAPALAPEEMRNAREKLERANAAMTAKDYTGARLFAQQAQVDAQLAESRAESAKARKAADEVQEASRALREEMARKTQ